MKKKPEGLHAIARDAVENWFVQTKVVSTPHQLDLNKKFSEYGMSFTEIADLSRHVESYFRQTKGYGVVLNPDWIRQQVDGTVHNFLTALPGRPSTGMGGPIFSGGRDFGAEEALPGLPSTPPSGPFLDMTPKKKRKPPEEAM